MSTPNDPGPSPLDAPPPRGLRRLVSVALFVVLGGTALLAVQNCSGASPTPNPPGTTTTPPPQTNVPMPVT